MSSKYIQDNFLNFIFAFYIITIQCVVFEINVPKGTNLIPIETQANNKVCEGPENQIESPLKHLY